LLQCDAGWLVINKSGRKTDPSIVRSRVSLLWLGGRGYLQRVASSWVKSVSRRARVFLETSAVSFPKLWLSWLFKTFDLPGGAKDIASAVELSSGMSSREQDRSRKTRADQGALRRMPHTVQLSSSPSPPSCYLSNNSPGRPRPARSRFCDSLPGPRSPPCRPDAIVLQVPATLPLPGPAPRFQGGLRSAAYHHLAADRPADWQGRNKLIQPMYRLLSARAYFLPMVE